MRKLVKAEQAKAEGQNPLSEKKKKPEVKKEDKSNKWYMGIYGGEQVQNNMSLVC